MLTVDEAATALSLMPVTMLPAALSLIPVTILPKGLLTGLLENGWGWYGRDDETALFSTLLEGLEG